MKAQNADDFSAQVGKRIAEIRKAADITQEKLAEQTGLDRMTIALIETGKKKPSLTTIYKIAFALRVEPYTFFQGA